jgi:hypothetical protein
MFATIWSVLSSSLWFWEIAGYVCTFVVILGCAGEYIAEFTSIPKGEDDKHRISKLSLIILTIGIAGELLTAIRSSQISGQVIADLQTSVKNAKQSASDAADDAKRAKTDADGAKTKADAVGVEADQAQGKITAVNTRADLLNAQIAATQRAFSARDLPDRDGLIEKLKEFRGKTVSVRSYIALGDVDGYRTCEIVLDLARQAGMNPIDECATLSPSIPPATGIRVCGPDDNEMLSLSRALGQIDIAGTCTFGPVPHSPNLTISVGAKALISVGQTFQTRAAEKEAAAAKRKTNKPSKPKAKP